MLFGWLFEGIRRLCAESSSNGPWLVEMAQWSFHVEKHSTSMRHLPERRQTTGKIRCFLEALGFFRHFWKQDTGLDGAYSDPAAPPPPGRQTHPGTPRKGVSSALIFSPEPVCQGSVL